MIALLGALAAFVAVSACVIYITSRIGPSGEAGLMRLQQVARAEEEVPFSTRVMIPVIGGITRLFMEVMPHSFVRRISSQLDAAGRPITTEAYFAVLLVTAVMLPGTILVLGILSANGAMGTLSILFALMFVFLGIMLPLLWLRRRVRQRKLHIWKALPDAFDLITVCVEAGLGLDAALRHVTDKLRGPLSDEISQMLREVGIGRARREALEDMAQRVQVRELTTFVNAIIQAEQLGTSLGRVLRAQGVTMRTQRRQRAEEMARKAPVKLVFPLVFCIMPAFFVFMLGPLVIHLLKYLHS